jgi:hypothetical protein
MGARPAEAAFIIPEAKRNPCRAAKGLKRRRLPQRSETEQRSGTIHHEVPEAQAEWDSPSTIQCAFLYSFRFVFFGNEYPWSACAGCLALLRVCSYSEVCLNGRNLVGHQLLIVRAAGQQLLVGAMPINCFSFSSNIRSEACTVARR